MTIDKFFVSGPRAKNLTIVICHLSIVIFFAF